MADFELLAPGGHQKLVDEVVDRLDLKADIDGYYAQLTAGAADNLTGRGDATTAEFLYRTAGGTADIETGQAVAKSIKGNTLVWNQLVQITNRTATSQGITYTAQDGKATFSAPNGAEGREAFYTMLGYNYTPIAGHKYIAYGTNADSTVVFTHLQMGTLPNTVFTNQATQSGQFSLIVSESFTGTYECYPMLFDLTQMFGAGNEPSTVAEFEALFPLPYYEYDAGSLLSVNMEGITTDGFNQWDEEWEVGGIDHTTGANTTLNTVIRSKNMIPVFPGTDYVAHFPVNQIWIHYYDAGGNFISYVSGEATTANNKCVAFTTPSNAHFVKFNLSTNYGATYQHDVCINLSWSGRRNGEYEPYWSAQRAIDTATYFTTGLKKAGTVYDELTATEAIQRVGVVDLGTLNWHTDVVENRFRSDAFYPAKYLGGVTCAKYGSYYNADSNLPDKTISITNSQALPFIRIHDSAYTDAANLKAAMDGVLLFYELATPTTTPIDPPLNLTYKVDDFGTERVMVPEDERSAPPVLDIAYGLNVVDFVRRAPTQYISAASFAQYLLARDAHDGTTTTMAWDDTDNRYEFTITDVETEG